MSGKAMQRTDSPGGSAESEKSRTESEGQARPLFLPRKGALPRPKLPFRTAVVQVNANTLFTKTLQIQPPPRQSRSQGQNHAHSCTLTAGHYSAPRTLRLYSDNGSRL